jgi:hypothetical protein
MTSIRAFRDRRIVLCSAPLAATCDRRVERISHEQREVTQTWRLVS